MSRPFYSSRGIESFSKLELLFLVALAKLRKSAISFVIYAYPSARPPAQTGQWEQTDSYAVRSRRMACSKSREECTEITQLFIVPQFTRDSKKFRYYISPLLTYFDCSCISCWWFTYHFTKSVTVVLIEGVWGHIKSWIVKLYSKVKCTLVQALRLCTGRTAHRESRGIALPFLGHSTRRGWGVSVTPQPLFIPGKDPVPIVQEAGWAPGPVWTGAEILAPTGIRSPELPTHSQSLYRLRYPIRIRTDAFYLPDN